MVTLLFFMKGHLRDIYKQKDHVYVKSLLDLAKYYKVKYNYDNTDSIINMFKLKTINKDGNVEPLKSWISQAYYDMVN